MYVLKIWSTHVNYCKLEGCHLPKVCCAWLLTSSGDTCTCIHVCDIKISLLKSADVFIESMSIKFLCTLPVCHYPNNVHVHMQSCQLVRFCRILYVFLKENTAVRFFPAKICSFKFLFFFFFSIFFFFFFFFFFIFFFF